MIALPVFAAGLAAALPPGGLDCLFESASIDGRPGFPSVAVAAADPLPEEDGIALLRFGDEPAQLAWITREGVWLSLRTDPDIDHDQRVIVLDIAETGPEAGRAVMVISQPGSAAQMLSREGSCAPRGEAPA